MPYSNENRLAEGDLIALRRTPDLVLYGFPDNHAHETSLYEALLFKLSQATAEGLVFAATGAELDANLSVSAGHQHDGYYSRLDWWQEGSWPFPEDKDSSNHEGRFVDTTAPTLFAAIPLRLALDGTPRLINGTLIPRFRVSVPAAGYSTNTALVITSTLYTIPTGLTTATGLSTATPLQSVSVIVQSSSTYQPQDTWITGGLFLLSETDATLTTSAGLLLTLSASISTAGDKATVWEFALGYREVL